MKQHKILWCAVVEWVGFYFHYLLATFQFLENLSVSRDIVDAASYIGNTHWPQIE